MPVPTVCEPVNDTALILALEVIALPTIDPGPVITLSTPRGSPTWCAYSASLRAIAGATSDGFITTVFPAVSAGAIFQAGMAIGKFQGVMSATGPSGCRSV